MVRVLSTTVSTVHRFFRTSHHALPLAQSTLFSHLAFRTSHRAQSFPEWHSGHRLDEVQKHLEAISKMIQGLIYSVKRNANHY